ncbi:ABC transporter ATP-binding protein [Paenibacillus chungangensis]|uniref:ABC transporter ATP-binding protein n=1 Tax=Paenibacillus chungangensis TaxID=696535 RepID=A0ABW3HP91_9BACL
MRGIRYFIGRIYRYSGPILLYNFIAMLFIGVLQSIGFVFIIPLLNMTGIVALDMSSVPVVSDLMGKLEGIANEQSLLAVLIVYILLIVGQSLFNWHLSMQNKRIQQGFIRQLREDTYRSIIRANWSFFLAQRKSDLVKLMTTEIGNVKKGLNYTLQFLSSLILTSVKVGAAVILAPGIALTIISIGAALLLCSRYFTRRAKQFGYDNLMLSKVYAAGITDHLNGMKDIKGNTLETAHEAWMTDLCGQVERNSIDFAKLKASSQFIYQTVSAVLLAIFVYFLLNMFQSQPAELLLVIMLFASIWPMIVRIQISVEKLAAMAPSFESVIHLQQLCLSERELGEEQLAHDRRINLRQGLTCRSVSFRYNREREHYALNNVSLHIAAGGLTAIVGASGAGKTTLVDMLMGLNEPECGEVLVDGERLTCDNAIALRRSISYVSQDPFLFNASIRDNLKLLQPEAADDRLWKALELAAAAKFVKRLPHGLDTFIGDRGVRLSGGEKQRLVLARALLREPSILILDEATSALDTETEWRVQETLARLQGTMTMIVIAHRLSTIRHADQVVVLDGGEVRQVGTYQELANERGGLFSKLLGKQVGVPS